MTLLTVWPDDDTETVLHHTTDEAQIRAVLAPLGVRFERWPVVDVPAGTGPEELLSAYRERVERVTAAEGPRTVDVVALSAADGPERAAAARAEHTYDVAVDRFFARGAGVVYLHLDKKVHAVLCEAGDVLGVPAGATHWLDTGARPDFAVIRFFPAGADRDGDVTGSPIAQLFPDFDALLAGHRAAAAPAGQG